MGGGRWDPTTWTTYSAKSVDSARSVREIYRSTSVDPMLDPKGVSVRESCDSTDNPNSTALIVALDVTGSMGRVLEAIARTGLKTLAEEVYNRKPITDPHIMFMGVGDVEYDSGPLQVTQFEADIRIAEQLQKLWLEEGGGGNHYESYTLPWYFAAAHTKIDCFDKRNKKGYLFTIGDEELTPVLHASDLESVLGYKPQGDLTADELYAMVSRQYEVFHLMVEEGSYFRARGDDVVKSWTRLLGQRAIRLADHTKIGEVITSILQREAGVDRDTIVGSWDGTTGLVVARAIDSLTPVTESSDGVIKFS